MTILKIRKSRSLVIKFLFIAFLLVIVHKIRAEQFKAQDEQLGVDLIGYNYTNSHISNYSVDGSGGGDIRLSSPTSGGGGIVCCISLPTRNPIIVRVRWQIGGCSYLMKSPITGRTRTLIHDFYREKYVEVLRPKGMRPRHLESHFYPDGSVMVLLTNNMSLPRLSLSETRPDKSQFQRCKDDKKPG